MPPHVTPCGYLWMPGTGRSPTVRTMSEFTYAYVRVADQVEAEIRSGKLPHGARLPNERDMGALYGVAIRREEARCPLSSATTM